LRNLCLLNKLLKANLLNKSARERNYDVENNFIGNTPEVPTGLLMANKYRLILINIYRKEWKWKVGWCCVRDLEIFRHPVAQSNPYCDLTGLRTVCFELKCFCKRETSFLHSNVWTSQTNLSYSQLHPCKVNGAYNTFPFLQYLQFEIFI